MREILMWVLLGLSLAQYAYSFWCVLQARAYRVLQERAYRSEAARAAKAEEPTEPIMPGRVYKLDEEQAALFKEAMKPGAGAREQRAFQASLAKGGTPDDDGGNGNNLN